MPPETATQIVRAVMSAVMLLDAAVAAAAEEGVAPTTLRRRRRAAGQVMGLSYEYLAPCFRARPDLDPAGGGGWTEGDPGLAVGGSPEEFVRLLTGVEEAIAHTEAVYDAAASATERKWLLDARRDLLSAIAASRNLVLQS